MYFKTNHTLVYTKKNVVDGNLGVYLIFSFYHRHPSLSNKMLNKR